MPRGPLVEFIAGSTSFPWTEFQIVLPRNEPATFGIKMPDTKDRAFAPGEENPYLDSTASKDHSWLTQVRTSGGTFTPFPTWLQNDYQFTGDAASNTIQVAGGDYSLDLLKHKDEAMDDVRNVTSQTALSQIASAFDFTVANTAGGYDMQQMHRIGCPLDWVRLIIEPKQAWYRWDGTQMRVQQTVFPGSAHHVLTDRHHLKLLAYRRNTGGVYNTVTVERMDGNTASGIVATAEKSGGDSLGIQTVNFEIPVYVARPTIKVKRGTAHTFTYRDGSGPLSNIAPAGSGNLYSYNRPATSVTFIVEPGANATQQGPYTPEYEGYFWGISTQPSGETYADYSQTWSDPADVAKHGILRWPRAIVNPLIKTKQMALEYAKRWVGEAVRTYVSARVETLFNHEFLPGQIVDITDYWTKISGEKFAIDSVLHSGTGDSLLTTLELSRPAAFE